ncbi:EthD family reductase [Variovorax sp.]|uniref:EthD family reductase n=1 Tax=Variovorax sp. TaxID=1871043 RepID=UPI002D6B742F|nr:EthD family reductase [Variovorax sp.]HYP83589.1 EthD family reductase [Variovorax sp.]
MIKVSVVYPNDEGHRFDWDYYVGKHMPMVRELLGDALRRDEIEEGLSGPAPGSRAPFAAAVHMYFDSLEAFQGAFGPHAKGILKDVANYTDLRPITQISKLR